MSRIFGALESIVLLLACYIGGSTTHLTWWNAGLLAVCDAAYVWSPQSMLFKRLWSASAVLSVFVQIAVIAMSLMGCSMIRNALRDVGPWMYYFGNFALHYWPTIRVASMRPHDVVEIRQLYFDAARIFAIYSVTHRATEVYKCDNIDEAAVLPLGLVILVVIEAAVTFCVQSVRGDVYAAWRHYLRKR